MITSHKCNIDAYILQNIYRKFSSREKAGQSCIRLNIRVSLLILLEAGPEGNLIIIIAFLSVISECTVTDRLERQIISLSAHVPANLSLCSQPIIPH